MSRLHTRAGVTCVLAALTVGPSACGGEGDQLLTGPTRVRTPLPAGRPSPPAAVVTVTGRVIEFASSGAAPRPVPNLRLQLRTAGPDGGAVGGTPLPDIVTDANGRYEIPDVSSYVLFVRAAPGSDYTFLCDFYPVFTRFTSDLPVVHVTWAGDRLPSGVGIAGTSVHGVISERVGDSTQTVAGATVSLEDGQTDPAALTNAAGFYMICSAVGADQFRTITARKDGYVTATRQIFGGWDFEVDLELARP